ncbi:MAG TPA: LLM class flavin-dependent oxidoreductase [Bacteroidia bacterium]|jgi:luciferase family oxidoreductase group 1|nr:LLM class flavin-dependent oxidoreductase [Bacteroidia bacterium]
MSARKLKLSILDQSIIRKGGTARQAIAETIETAKIAEQLGFYRFWVSEHHNSTLIAGSAPEVLMVKLADETQHIRIGSGGIMLPNHSALKVAENFRLLETLFPGRIDFGIGRAPGGDRVTSALLNPSNTFSEESYLTQLEHLHAYFRDEASTGYGRILAVPQSNSIPQQWILCSSVGGSSSLAAKLGLGLVVARFINGNANPEMVHHYKKNFQPSDEFKKPQAMLAISVLCADTEEKANALRKLSDYNLLKFERGIFEPMSSPEDIADYKFSPEELFRIQNNRGRIVSGTPEQVKSQLSNLAEEFDVNEIIVTTMTYSHADRMHSFKLLANAFELKPITTL